MKRCILHLGMPKTASTSIQKTLMDNRFFLQNHGWEYPVFHCPEHGHQFFLHNDPLCRIFMPEHPFHVLRPAQNKEINLEIQKRALRKALLEYTRKSDKIILSSEALLDLKPLTRIRNFFKKIDFVVEPIIYIRSPYSFRVSLYQSLLRFSQLQRSAIIEHLQQPIIKRRLSHALSVFGENTKIYPFNNLIQNNTEIVTHFFGNFLHEDIVDKLDISRENESLSRHAVTLLEYIEEKSPLYKNNIQNKDRSHGDIHPLYSIQGEKFGFDQEKAEFFKDIIALENNWLNKQFGQEYCDNDYGKDIHTTPLRWEEQNISSLLEVFPCLNTKIQSLIIDYISHYSRFPSKPIHRKTVRDMKRTVLKKRLITVAHKLMNTVKSYFLPGKR